MWTVEKPSLNWSSFRVFFWREHFTFTLSFLTWKVFTRERERKAGQICLSERSSETRGERGMRDMRSWTCVRRENLLSLIVTYGNSNTVHSEWHFINGPLFFFFFLYEFVVGRWDNGTRRGNKEDRRGLNRAINCLEASIRRAWESPDRLSFSRYILSRGERERERERDFASSSFIFSLFFFFFETPITTGNVRW